MSDVHKRTLGIAAAALLASSATLVCCVLPAVLVSLGAGAALLGLVSIFPQLIWLSEHKVFVFAAAGILLTLSGAMVLHGRRLPCPADPTAARACNRLRRFSQVLCVVAAAIFVLGFLFAFVA